MKKPRIQSSLDRQPLHVIQAIKAMLTTGGSDGHGVTYKEAQTRIKEEFDIHLSITALSNFYRRHHKLKNTSAPIEGHTITFLPGQKCVTLNILVSAER